MVRAVLAPVRGSAPVRPARACTVDEDTAQTRTFATVAADGIFGLVLPIAALVIGDSVLGAEVRAGTFHFTWLSPTPTWLIVLGRWTGGSLVALATIARGCTLAAVVAGTPESAGAAFVAAAVGSTSYVAVYSSRSGASHAGTTVWSLAFVFLVERLLGAALTGIAQLSPTWESRAISSASSTMFHVSRSTPSIPTAGSAIVRLAIVTVVVLALATWRIGRMRLGGATD